jgi:hypothetical protein
VFVMSRYLAPAAALVGLIVSTPLAADEPRIWTDSSGKFKTRAEFVSLEGELVTLRQPSTGKEIQVPLVRLSDADQEYVDDLLREQEQQEESSRPRQPRIVTPPSATAGDAAAGGTGRRPPNNVINSVRGAVYRAETRNNLRQIGVALLAYESSRGRFPTTSINTADGKPGLSWRVALLPFVEMESLYRQFKLDEPWDSDHNKSLVAQMPSLYQSPGSDLDEGYTNYLAIVSPDTIITNGRRGVRTTDVRDGTSRTVMVVEADDTYAAVWTQPTDYDWDPAQPAYGLGGIWSGMFFVIYGDGHVDQVDLSIGNEALNGLFTRSGGEVIP